MHNKDYTQWMKAKTAVNNSGMRPQGYHEREIYWVNVGNNIGFEEDGKGAEYFRPVLVLKGFSRQLFYGVPLSTTDKRGRFYFAFTAVGKTEISVALLSQMRAFDTLRLANRYGEISAEDFAKLKQEMMRIISCLFSPAEAGASRRNLYEYDSKPAGSVKGVKTGGRRLRHFGGKAKGGFSGYLTSNWLL